MHFTISFSAFLFFLIFFFFKLIRCISFHRLYLNNTELKTFGRHQESNPRPLSRFRGVYLFILNVVLGSIPGGNQIFLIFFF